MATKSFSSAWASEDIAINNGMMKRGMGMFFSVVSTRCFVCLRLQAQTRKRMIDLFILTRISEHRCLSCLSLNVHFGLALQFPA